MDDTVSSQVRSETDLVKMTWNSRAACPAAGSQGTEREPPEGGEPAPAGERTAEADALFVASVVEVMGTGGVPEAAGEQPGVPHHVNEELQKTLKPGTKVAVNNALSVVKIIVPCSMPGCGDGAGARLMSPSSR